ncbi:AAA family ATPase [Domibacillus robiginosus]|uniref:AAA family ATPase n=1 Tax=Domibacillus robiginosus TaxID=1071054 RepID=UPI00067B6471|nr:AAA family ATPase [Domibacillus robiginosus]
MFLRKVTLLREHVHSFEQYPYSIPSIRSMTEVEIKKPITFFVGENGAGKSTLLEAIADKCGFHTAGGGRNNVYQVDRSNADLSDAIRLSWLPKVTDGFFLRAESFYQFASHVEAVDSLRAYGYKSLHEQSHGESFMSLFLNRFHDRNAIYLLDEPEAALSPQRQLSFLRIMHDLTMDGSAQFIIATHSPLLLGFPGADILNFDDHMNKVDYEDTDHYQITAYFLRHREKMIADLFEDKK